MNIMFSLENINRIASHRIASHRIASHRIASHRIASHKYSIIKNYPQKNINYKFLKILIYIYAFSFGIAIINFFEILSYHISFLFNKFYFFTERRINMKNILNLFTLITLMIVSVSCSDILSPKEFK